MKNRIQKTALAVCAITAALCVSVQAQGNLQTESQAAIAEFQNADPTMQKFFSDSAGYAVFPNVGKGGFIVGGARGKGIVYETNSVVGMATMTQASIGAQAGGQTFAEVIFFQSPDALNDFKSGKFEMSAEVSAVAARQGASEAANYKNGVAVFTLARKGLMVQASIGGQKFSFEPLSMQSSKPSP